MIIWYDNNIIAQLLRIPEGFKPIINLAAYSLLSPSKRGGERKKMTMCAFIIHYCYISGTFLYKSRQANIKHSFFQGFISNLLHTEPNIQISDAAFILTCWKHDCFTHILTVILCNMFVTFEHLCVCILTRIQNYILSAGAEQTADKFNMSHIDGPATGSIDQRRMKKCIPVLPLAPVTIYRTDFDILQIYNENTEWETSKQLRKSVSGKTHRPRSDQELSIAVESTPKSTTHHICLTIAVCLGSCVPSATDRKQNSTLNKWNNVSRCMSFSPVFLTVRHKVCFPPRWQISCFCQFPPQKLQLSLHSYIHYKHPPYSQK